VYESVEGPCAPAIDPLFPYRFKLFSKLIGNIPLLSFNFPLTMFFHLGEKKEKQIIK